MPARTKREWPLKNSALLIVDAQHFFLPLVPGAKATLRNIQRLAEAARGAEIPVIHTLIKYDPDPEHWPELDRVQASPKELPIEGTENAEEIPGLNHEEDHYLDRHRFSAFHDTGLQHLLEELGVDTLIITGFLTHQCVLLSALDAYQRDFRVIIPRDAVNSDDKVLHKHLLNGFLKEEVGEVNSTQGILKRLKGFTGSTDIEDVEWEA